MSSEISLGQPELAKSRFPKCMLEPQQKLVEDEAVIPSGIPGRSLADIRGSALDPALLFECWREAQWS
jgi:hypothetical protein